MATDTLTPDAATSGAQTAPLAGPYVGLRPYEASERDRFFGRDADALFLRNKILAARLTVFYSQSGLGKSSLLRALVMPQLAADGPVIYFDAWSQDAPLAALKEELAKCASSLGIASPEAGAPTLTQLVRLVATEDPRPMTLVLDQFEEFLIAHPQQLDPLRGELAALVRAPVAVHIVLSLREEFLAALEPFREHILSLFQSTHRLEPLDANSLRDAIRLPPRVFNGSCDDDLVERLIRDLAARTQAPLDAPATGVELPMLQLVCRELWNQAQLANQSRMTVDLYDRAGGVTAILDRYIDVSMPRRWQDRVLAARMMRLLAPQSGVKMAYSVADLAENINADPDRVKSLLNALAADRILKTRHSRHGPRYELQHDAFIGVITPWRDRVLARRERLRQTFVTLAVVAGLVGIVGGGLWIDRRYRQSAAREITLRGLVNEIENRLESRPAFNLLLAAGAFAAGQSEQPEVRSATESALRRALTVVGGLPVSVGAPVQAAAVSRGGSTVVTAGAAGVQLWDATALVRFPPADGNPPEPRTLMKDAASGVMISPAGAWLAATSSSGVIRLWNLSDAARPPVDLPRRAAVTTLTFSADEQWLAIGLGTDVELWSLATSGRPERRIVLPPPRDVAVPILHAVRFGPSPGGQSLFVAYEGETEARRQGTVLRWALDDLPSPPELWWTEPAPLGYIAMAFGDGARWLGMLTVSDTVRVADLAGRQASVGLDVTGIVGGGSQFAALTFGPGDMLAVADRSGAIGLWNATSRQRSRVLRGHDDLIVHVSFSADGRWLTSAARDGTGRLWDLGQRGTHPWIFGADGEVARDLAFAGEHPWLVTAGSGGVHRFDLRTRPSPGLLLAAPQAEFGVLAVSSDGRWLAAGRDDGVVLLWADPFAERPSPPEQLGMFDDRVTAMAVSPDGGWLAAGGIDGLIRLWRLRPDAAPQLAIDHTHEGDVAQIAFSPDNTWLATGSGAGDVAIWRLDPTARLSATQPPKARRLVTALAWDRRGQLAVAVDDGNVRLWDAAGGRWLMEPWQLRQRGSEYVSSLAFSPDGRWLIAGTTLERLVGIQMASSVWRGLLARVTGRSNDAVVDLPRPWLAGAGNLRVRALVFAADGRLATSISNRPVTVEVVANPNPTELGGPQAIDKLVFSGIRNSDRFVGAIGDGDVIGDQRAWVWDVTSDRRPVGQRDVLQLACRAAGRPGAPQVCSDLRTRLGAFPDWDVCGVCRVPDR